MSFGRAQALTLSFLAITSAVAIEQSSISFLIQNAEQLASGATKEGTLISGARPLHRGVSGADVLQAKQRMNEIGFPMALNDQFDPELDANVREYQLGMNMKEDGIIDKQTRFNLNLTDARRRELLLWQIPQMQALNRQAPVRYIVVNIPAYTLTAYENEKTVLISKVIIGKSDRETPLLRTQIQAIKYNPDWHVPPVVIQNDLIKDGKLNLSKIQKHHLRMSDSNGNEVNPAEIAASGETNFARYRYSQDAGAKNALGRLKFELSNSNGIYLHDTPSKGIFGKENRAASSGCVRVQEWQALAAWVLNVKPAIIGKRISEGRTYTEALAEPVRVYFVYWPAQIEAGKVRWYDDIYGLYQSNKGVNPALVTQ
ncbi:L,D-transpeptidase family protein [Chitinibacter bivalviorum]|uniref:L,D-transpeptidase family protein n=1 Tax=Chitinibacter bivalviorum TaxID=2739434 RepID=A0A7H9BFP1_9NEIS|nr:L,D-transpeptidase family protein [Chitinibacter bivalviorum]QLG87533.1 L,D-transpeptidase family protein [Chitinibacter bivalviorum]